jgi:hypothetical protein
MFAVILLFLWPFNHGHKPTPSPATPTAAQIQSSKQYAANKQFVKDGEEGLKAFLADETYAQYERPEIEDFARTLYQCEQDINDPAKLDADTDVLSDKGLALQALDHRLHFVDVI